MAFHEDLRRLFSFVLAEREGNQRRAAEFLGVSPVTFFGWLKRDYNTKESALSRAIDKAGGRLLLPNDDLLKEYERLKTRNEYLEMQVSLLKENIELLREERERERERESKNHASRGEK